MGRGPFADYRPWGDACCLCLDESLEFNELTSRDKRELKQPKQSSKCKDKKVEEECQKHKQKGHCEKSKSLVNKYVRTIYCRKTCGLCSALETWRRYEVSCSNTYDQYRICKTTVWCSAVNFKAALHYLARIRYDKLSKSAHESVHGTLPNPCKVKIMSTWLFQ